MTLDDEVHSVVMGLTGEPPPYSSDMTAAWLVHNKACDFLFSRRRRYLAELGGQAVTDDGVPVAWPDVLVVLRERFPEAICKAALQASR